MCVCVCVCECVCVCVWYGAFETTELLSTGNWLMLLLDTDDWSNSWFDLMFSTPWHSVYSLTGSSSMSLCTLLLRLIHCPYEYNTVWSHLLGIMYHMMQDLTRLSLPRFTNSTTALVLSFDKRRVVYQDTSPLWKFYWVLCHFCPRTGSQVTSANHLS